MQVCGGVHVPWKQLVHCSNVVAYEILLQSMVEAVDGTVGAAGASVGV